MSNELKYQNKTITKLCQLSHETAKSKGWWDKERNFGEQIALMHSELSEALEAKRNPEHKDSPEAATPDYAQGKRDVRE